MLGSFDIFQEDFTVPLQLLQLVSALLRAARHLLDVIVELLAKLLRRFFDIAAHVFAMLRDLTRHARDHLAVVAVELDLLVGVLDAIARCHLQQRLGTRLVRHLDNLMQLGGFHCFMILIAFVTQMFLTFHAEGHLLWINSFSLAHITLFLTHNISSCSAQLVGEQQLVDKEVVGQVSEASRRNHKVGSTERTGHLVSRLVVLAVLEQTLETERVHARQHFRVGERLHAYRTFRDVAYLFGPTFRSGHV